MVIDCDANATYTPSAETLDLVTAVTKNLFNPSSMHRGGQAARAAIEEARATVRRVLDVGPHDSIVFTSGASEANNTVVNGILESGDEAVATQVEHPCVLAPLESARFRGVKVTLVSPMADGAILPESIGVALTSKTRLVSVMAANNETGIVVPISEVVKIVRQRSPHALVHTDAAQLLGKQPVSFRDLGVDLMTVSGHKIGALSGVGVLLIRENIQLRPLIVGGAQEEKLRGGTENVLGIVVFGAVLQQLEKELSSRIVNMRRSRDEFEAFILRELPDCVINGAELPRLPNTSSVYVPGVRADDLVVALDLAGVLASTGAACSSGKREPSHVLLAMGQEPQRASSTVRFSMRADTSSEQVLKVCEVFRRCVARIRATKRENPAVDWKRSEDSMVVPLESNS